MPFFRSRVLRNVWSIAVVLCFEAFTPTSHSQSNSLVQVGHINIQGYEVAYRIRNLPVNAFPDLPTPVVIELEARGCTIPQTYQAKRPENVIHGSFQGAGSSDWAVLCLADSRVSLLVFFENAKTSSPEIVASAGLTDRTQPHDSTGILGFDWGIDTATPKQVHDAQAGMVHRPSPPPYDCVADTALGRNTRYRLYWHGEWGEIDTE